ncbi:helix-turn-helix domain-containing protein [Elizabethkingia anophelis]|uniref:helix-turn-helix domain-containing protein n=1 Tax=Elizabethkingia anophelis TaxID=1117645 RepID=UPI00389237E6
MATFEQRQQTQKAQMIVDKYKEFNKATVEQVKTYDPVLRCWYFKKVKIDENAKNMTSYLKGLDRQQQTEKNRIKNERRNQAKEVKVKKIKPKNTHEPLFIMIGTDFFKKNIEVEELSEKYKKPIHNIRQFVYRYARKNNIEIPTYCASVKKQDQVLKLYEQGFTCNSISEQLKMCRKTVKKILNENGIELSNYKKAA